MNREPLIVFTTFPDAPTARRVVHTLVEEKLVACGNLIPAVESIYRWRGAIEKAAEIFVVLKTERARYQHLEARLLELHPAEVAECIAFPASEGSAAYLRWISDAVTAA